VSVDRRRGIDFFVSYTGSDEGWAEWIAWQLKDAGFQVRLQKWHFDEAVRKAQRTIAVLSPAYLRSAYCETEWQKRRSIPHSEPYGELCREGTAIVARGAADFRIPSTYWPLAILAGWSSSTAGTVMRNIT
jgi:hypothetical protein